MHDHERDLETIAERTPDASLTFKAITADAHADVRQGGHDAFSDRVLLRSFRPDSHLEPIHAIDPKQQVGANNAAQRGDRRHDHRERELEEQ